MEPVWNGMLTCDYEHTRPTATRLEWDLYTQSLMRWPATLMYEPHPYGRLRRPGIVDIDEADHTHLVALWHQRLASPAYVTDLTGRSFAWHRSTSDALTRAERALDHHQAPGARLELAKATSALLHVMSTHIVNWLLPEQQWEDLLTRLFSHRDRALTCLLALMTPPSTSHLLDAHTQLLHAAGDLAAGASPREVATTVAASAGTLFGSESPAVAAMPMEDPDHTEHAVRAVTEDPANELGDIDTTRNRTLSLHQAWTAAAVLAAAGDTQALTQVRLMTELCSWAASSEESRKVLRHRYLAAVRRWCETTGADPRHVTTADLLSVGDK